MQDIQVGSLGLLGWHLTLPATLRRIRSVLSVQNVVPPTEAAGEVTNELLVVEIMVIGTGPERQEVVETPGELIAAVRVDSLEQAQDNPNVHGENVQVTSDGTPDDGTADGSEAQNHNLNRRCVFSGQTERSRVLVVDLVNGLVERAPVQGTVGKVVPGILHHKEDRDLVGHGPQRREGNRGGKTEELSHWVEEPVENKKKPLAACQDRHHTLNDGGRGKVDLTRSEAVPR